jgi:chromosome condensin MukBEF MukE localization factor
MPTVYTEVEVDVELSDFDDDDLIKEVERRHLGVDIATDDAKELVEKIYHLRRLGRDYESELDQLIYAVTGRAV